MFQNIKVDIVYYKTGTDFEMEFNLCGCCRMRLLTDKTSDRQTLVHSLARAVSRSKVIAVVGPLFGENGIISLVASAIGNGLTVADSKACGINSNESIQIIQGSTPLITPEGCFGGCIIENGPQTMILLSESKSIRKPIMQTLIHPYIEQLCADELTGKTAQTQNGAVAPLPEELSDVSAEETAEPQNEAAEAEEPEAANADADGESADETEAASDKAETPISEESVSDGTETQAEPEMTVSGGMSFEEGGKIAEAVGNTEEPELLTEPMSPGRIRTGAADRAYTDFDGEGLITDEAETEKKGFTHFSELPILIISILLLVLIAALCYCIFYVPAANGTSPADYMRDIFNTLFK